LVLLDIMLPDEDGLELVSRVKALLRRTKEERTEKFFRLGDIFMDGERRIAFVNEAPYRDLRGCMERK